MNGAPAILDFVIVAVLFPCGTFYGRALAERGIGLNGPVGLRSVKLLALLVLTFILSNLLLLFARSYPALSWYLPVVVEYYATPGLFLLNIAAMAFAFSAIMALGFKSRARARWIVPIVCIAIFALVEFRFRTSPLVAPAAVGPERIGEGGVVMQTGEATCSAAACASVARSLGFQATEREMVDLLRTTAAGTSPAQIVYGMRTLGFVCTKHYVNDKNVLRIKPPAVLFVLVGNEVDAHSVALISVQDGTAEIWDPRFGLTRIASNDFSQRWGGRAIEISRP